VAVRYKLEYYAVAVRYKLEYYLLDINLNSVLWAVSYKLE